MTDNEDYDWVIGRLAAADPAAGGTAASPADPVGRSVLEQILGSDPTSIRPELTTVGLVAVDGRRTNHSTRTSPARAQCCRPVGGPAG